MSSKIENKIEKDYKFGFKTNIKDFQAPEGLSEEIVRFISKEREEPAFMLEFRLKAFQYFKTLSPPTWSDNQFSPLDFSKMHFYSRPDKMQKKQSLEEVDPEILKTFDKLGIPLWEQKRLTNVAVDAIFDSVSIATTFKEELSKSGIIFCSLKEAVDEHPELVKKYLATVVSYKDNYYSALNSCVFTDGSFCYIPKGVKAPMDLSSYFRINASNTGQFERTLIIADEGSFVNYIEGCTAPAHSKHQLHAAIVEIIAHKNACVNYSTVQNWYAGNKDGLGGIYNFVTKRGLCEGENSFISWTQIETGSAITWKYPSVILKGNFSRGEFYSVAITNNKMQADTGTKMIHLGENTSSTIISKGISLDSSRNTYRGLVRIAPQAHDSKNYTQCDSLLIGSHSKANTLPTIESSNSSSSIEHEASVSNISEEELLYLKKRGIPHEKAISLVLNGFCQEVFEKLPMEFAVEVTRLLDLKLSELPFEGSVG